MYNYLKTNAIKMSISHMPDVSFYCQNSNIPSIQINPAIQPTPFIDIPHGGDKIQKDTLNVSFIVDEDMKNYLEVFKWIKSYGFPKDYDDIQHLKTIRGVISQNFEELLKTEVVLTILNSDNNPNIGITYYDCVPFQLSGVNFDIRDNEVNYSISTITFAFRDFNITKL